MSRIIEFQRDKQYPDMDEEQMEEGQIQPVQQPRQDERYPLEERDPDDEAHRQLEQETPR